jgi:hypothetical protein
LQRGLNPNAERAQRFHRIGAADRPQNKIATLALTCGRETRNTKQSDQEHSMTTIKLFAAGLMASTLLGAPALAQSSPPAQPSKPMASEPAKPMASEPAKPADATKADAAKSDAAKSDARPPVAAQSTTAAPAAKTAQQSGEWRASKLVGLNVYNDSNEKIGDINELISGKDGKIQTVVIGVGGFLGLGEHRVGLTWDQIKFVDEPVKTSSTAPATSTSTRPATTGSAAPAATTTTASGTRDYPDHAVVSMTKDQLKALPAFKYNSDSKSR